MDQLPVEIISLIVEHLQQWNISDQPFSHLTETSKDGTVGWLTHTVESRRDVCNFRLVCHSFYNSSLRSFGEVLGNRIFRITKADLEDLEAISCVAALTPHIRTITFGSAQFDDISINQTLHVVLANIPAPHQLRLQAAYSRAFEWQRQLPHRGYVRPMEAVLNRLPNFENIRLLTSDHPDRSSHLRGWLDPGDSEIIAKAWHETAGGWPEDESIYDIGQASIRQQARSTVAAFFPLCCALQDAGTVLRELRIGLEDAVSPQALFALMNDTGMVSTLHRLRLQIDPRFFQLSHQQQSALYYECIFALLPNVTDLSLSLVHDARFWNFGSAASSLLQLLRLLPHLKQLTMRGNWAYNERDLVDFVTDHGEHLAKLALKGPVLSAGSWTRVVQQLASVRLSALQHLQLSDMSLMAADTRSIPAFNTTSWQDFVEDVRQPIEENVMCTVYLSSGDGEYIHCPSQS